MKIMVQKQKQKYLLSKLFLIIDFVPPDQVTKLMERVEAAFVKHFSNGNRGNGMNILRPKRRKEKHSITFFLGKI